MECSVSLDTILSIEEFISLKDLKLGDFAHNSWGVYNMSQIKVVQNIILIGKGRNKTHTVRGWQDLYKPVVTNKSLHQFQMLLVD